METENWVILVRKENEYIRLFVSILFTNGKVPYFEELQRKLFLTAKFLATPLGQQEVLLLRYLFLNSCAAGGSFADHNLYLKTLWQNFWLLLLNTDA